jgi:hypothetical protein
MREPVFRVTFEGDVADKEQVFDRVLVAVGPQAELEGSRVSRRRRSRWPANGFIETGRTAAGPAEPNIFAIR